NTGAFSMMRLIMLAAAAAPRVDAQDLGTLEKESVQLPVEKGRSRPSSSKVRRPRATTTTISTCKNSGPSIRAAYLENQAGSAAVELRGAPACPTTTRKSARATPA